MTLKHERYAACRRCAVEHPGEAATPLAVLSDDTPPYEGTALLFAAVRVTSKMPRQFHARLRSMPGPRAGRALEHGAGYEADPLSADPAVPVLLRCRRCGLKIGPISARRVAELFARGRADGSVLLLPVPPGQHA